MSDLPALIVEYQNLNREWAAFCAARDDDNDALWNAKEAAELAIIKHPCLTIDDVRAKARLALDDDNVFDSIRNCNINGEHELYVFLLSLMGIDGMEARS